MFLISILLAATLTTKADVPRISVTELHELMKKGDAVALDVRGSVPFRLGRIDGATWMPLGRINQRFAELPQDKLVVAYCTCNAEELSLEAVMLLANQHGFTRVAVLQGGYPAWKEAGLPVSADEELVAATSTTATVHFDQEPGQAAPSPVSSPAGGRLRPPDAVKCDPNNLTSFAGKVTSYRRGKDATVLVMHTSADTVETIRVAHAGKDPRHSYLLEAQPFTAADWKKIESKKGVLLPRMSAVAWVCSNGVTIVDWRPGTTFTGAE